MKAALAVLTLCFASAWAQHAPPNLLLESRASDLTIAFAGQDSTAYKFSISDRSSRGVTAIAWRLVPYGIAKVNGRYQCDSSCSGGSRIASKGKPVIKSGDHVDDYVFDIADVTGRAIVVEAALFDDGSFEGDERVAAFMGAAQVGDQGEWDRIIPTVDSVMFTNFDDVSKAQQIQSKLRKLPDSIDSAMIKSFQLRFKNLPDCNLQYAQTIKGSAAAEKRLVLESLEAYTLGLLPGINTLAQWWDKTKDTLSSFGCSGCAGVAPGTPAPVDVAYSSCSQGSQDHQTDTPVFFIIETAELTPDDNVAANDPAAAANTASAAPAPVVRNPTPAADRGSSSSSVLTPDGSRSMPDSPSMPPRDSRPVASIEPPSAQPLASESAYASLFQHIRFMDERAGAFETNGMMMSGFRDYDQRGAGLNDEEGAKLKKAAEEYNRADGKLQVAIYVFPDKYPGGEYRWVPPPPELRELNNTRIRVLQSQILGLRSGLGEFSFRKLNNYVIHNFEGRTATPHWPYFTSVPLRSFLRYISHLDEFAPKAPPARKESSNAWRLREQRAAGLNDSQWTILKQVADDYDQAIKKLPIPKIHPVTVTAQPLGVGGPRGMAPRVDAAQPAGTVQRGIDLGMIPPQIVPQPSGGQLSPQNSSPSLIAANAKSEAEAVRAFNDEQTRIMNEHVEQLKSKLGKPTFEKLDKYVNWLYSPFATEEQRCVMPSSTPCAMTAASSKSAPKP